VTEIEFRVLGPVEILEDGRTLGPATAQMRCVLAMLVLDLGRVVAAGRLASALWGSNPPASARNSIRVCVTKLRKLLAADPMVEIVTVGEGWRLTCDPERVDLYRFRDLVGRARGGPAAEAGPLLREGLSLWRGPALADVNGHWLTGAIGEGLEDERLAAIEDRIARDLESGDHQAVVPELSILVAEHPLRERPTQLLMSALHRSGRTVEGLQVYQRARMRLVEDLGIEPSAVLQNAHQRLLKGSEEPETDPSRTVPLPRQLPGDVAVFAGRATHLSHLDDLLSRSEREGRTLVATIAGIPGSGKTTLAVHWAHRVADRFPDGQLYLNLRGFDASGEVLDPADAVLRFLEALGVSAANIPAEADARSALYRSLLADRRMLIVLDNARDEAQVLPLLPGSTRCCVIVTGRAQLAGLAARHGAHLLQLDVFDAGESRDLLIGRIGTTRVQDEPEAAERIIEHCAGLPLSLTMVAARAAVQADFALSSLAAELERSEDVLDAFESPDSTIDLRTVFSWSYLRLSPEAARLFRLLGLHWGPAFTAEAAASLAGVPLRAVTRLIRELCRMQLVAEHAPGRFELHDLLGAYAAELTAALDTPDARRRAVRRLIDHYLHTAFDASRLFNPHRDPIRPATADPEAVFAPLADDGAATAWMSAEQTALLTAVRRASEHGLDVHCWQLAWTLHDHLRRRRLHHDQAAAWHTALEAANRLGDTAVQTRAHRQLAQALARTGRLEEARDHLDSALSKGKELNDPIDQAHTLQVSGLIWVSQEDFAEAIDCNLRALDAYRAAGHLSGQANTLNSIGWVHSRAGDNRAALEYCEQALELMRAIDHRPGQAATLDSLGLANHRLGRHTAAVDHYEQAIRTFRELDARADEADALGRLADTLLATGEQAAAREALERALGIYDEIGHAEAAKVRAALAALD
jgi:DNA-binding SARP family transcriptional activator